MCGCGSGCVDGEGRATGHLRCSDRGPHSFRSGVPDLAGNSNCELIGTGLGIALAIVLMGAGTGGRLRGGMAGRRGREFGSDESQWQGERV